MALEMLSDIWSIWQFHFRLELNNINPRKLKFSTLSIIELFIYKIGLIINNCMSFKSHIKVVSSLYLHLIFGGVDLKNRQNQKLRLFFKSNIILVNDLSSTGLKANDVFAFSVRKLSNGFALFNLTSHIFTNIYYAIYFLRSQYI